MILGPSGCGKTTLLHLIGGLLQAQSGSVEIDGVDLSSYSDSKLDAFRGKNIGLIFQRPHLIRALNVRDNLHLAARLGGVKTSQEEVHDLLKRLQLEHHENSKVNILSQGEQQRLSIARALVNKAPLILADEPTSALDDKNCHRVIDLLAEQSEVYNSTLVIVTHDQRLKDRFTNKIQL